MITKPYMALLSAGVAALVAMSASATELVRYSFDGDALTPASTHAQVAASDFGYSGDGATSFLVGHDAYPSFRATAWPLDLTVDDAFTFSITITQGYVVDLTDLSFFQFRSEDTGPTNWLVRYSRNGSTYYDMGEGDTTTSWRTQADKAGSTPPFDLTGTVYFKIHAVGASDAAGTWRVDDVVLNGTVRVDDRTRVLRYQGFDDPGQDNWSFTTNAAGGDVTNSIAMHYVGPRAVRLTGSSAGNNGPWITSANVGFSGVSNLQLQVAFAADEPDANEDLFLDVSYDNWGTSNTVKLADGSNGLDVAFGATSSQTYGANPFMTNLPSSATQVAIQIRFKETSGNNNTADFYFADDIRLIGKVDPAGGAPQVAVYGTASVTGADQATLVAHVADGYPYPSLTLHYGPADGGSDAGSWAFSSALGTKDWGLFTNALTGLQPGTIYYYTFQVENSQGSNWAPSSGSFVTDVAALSSSGRMYLDSFGVGTNMPLCIDADANGLGDRWEIATLGGTGGDPSGHSDGDGVSDGDEVLAGTDPTDANSFMRIVSVDLADETADDIAITVAGGDSVGTSVFLADQASGSRSFLVRAAAAPSSGKSQIGTVTDGGIGASVYTDSDAVNLYGSRYYDVGVSFAGASYTNTEEWAMHVQDRPAGEQFLICVPVKYGGTDDNFQGTLGEQLARGLFADLEPSTGDEVKFWTADGTWVVCQLSSNAQGDVQWTTNGVAADIAVTPGMAMWVYRSGSAAPRANAVFSGKSFAGTDAAQFTFKATNLGGWTAFGWPLPQSRSHSSTDASQNQLGFYSQSGAVGGRVSTTNETLLGDELWVWKNNTWQGFYSLLGNIGAPWDGRWWDNNRRRFADITLEPGAAYYYRHSTNWNSTDFTWTPQNP